MTALDFKKNYLTKNNINPLILDEYIDLVLNIETNKLWLQGILNLLYQLIGANSLHLFLFNENIEIFCPLKLNVDETSLRKIGTNITVKDGCYYYPFLYDGCLIVHFGESLSDEDFNANTKLVNYFFKALKIRKELMYKEKQKEFLSSLEKIEKALSESDQIKSQLFEISKEVCQALKTNRCQVKLFSSNASSTYDNSYSFEYSTPGILSALSVIPGFEQRILDQIRIGNTGLIEFSLDDFQEYTASPVENILQIKSAFCIPLICKKKVYGVLILHQCNYPRKLLEYEKQYLKEVVLLLGIVLGKELEVGKSKDLVVKDPQTNLLNSDEFLRIISHLQIESQIKKSPFSLILIDINKLNEINLSKGFVAGNLVLSQTSRYLMRMYGEKYKIARYNKDEFVIVLNGVNEKEILSEIDRLKNNLSNISVLGVGPVDYNFSFVTYPSHAESISEILKLLEQSMDVSKSRGASQICGATELLAGKIKLSRRIDSPEIFFNKTSFVTGPEVLNRIDSQLQNTEFSYHADILDSVQSLAIALDAKDSYTEGHSRRVSEYALMLAVKSGMDIQDQERVRLAAALHDIGKIGIPEAILCKNGKLTTEEFEIMKKHPVIGARILKPIKPLEDVASMVLYHHEYWDGSGYPHGFVKEDIPLGSRIVSITDAYQAMTSDRPYRAGMPVEEAFKRLREGKSKQWDPNLVDMFIDSISA